MSDTETVATITNKIVTGLERHTRADEVLGVTVKAWKCRQCPDAHVEISVVLADGDFGPAGVPVFEAIVNMNPDVNPEDEAKEVDGIWDAVFAGPPKDVRAGQARWN